MQLTEEQQSIVVGKLNQLWTNKRECLVCNNDKWTVSDKIFEIKQFSDESKIEGRKIPIITVTCSKCGNTILLNALTLGFEFDRSSSGN